ncbi:E3 ubiquitin-protein ligase PRT1 isoform X2 [Cucumis melo var. makuwa]|uniref:E3 ubiquitin-protein ligase PRT1 isoform X2 n=1 Tax=Cucumis melo var. makuwa TaxID=1194695 RepID=A0A5D3BZW8_CUCMM|nr:E3 ubiquitin-protein ligase PRT1 isoform X2 [Cucumis melo var. makuwa]TYK04635.1 E3 ubiquitin-protein ligase PRT1 isoform X2 [Cucumis melo var. makuwa]
MIFLLQHNSSIGFSCPLPLSSLRVSQGVVSLPASLLRFPFECLGVQSTFIALALTRPNSPLEPSRVCLLGILFINGAINVAILLLINTLSLWMSPFSYLCYLTCPRFSSHGPLPTNQVSWKSYYKKNLKKEIGSPTDQSTSIQDSKPPRGQDMREKDSVDEIEVRAETVGNEAEQDHSDACKLCIRRLCDWYSSPIHHGNSDLDSLWENGLEKIDGKPKSTG